MKIKIVGDIITVRGFGFAGIDGVVVQTAQEAKEAIRSMLTDEDVGLILVAQGIANKLGGEFDAYRFRKHLPLIMSVEDSTGEKAAEDIMAVVQKSLGLKL
ncbi:V-type ATP synthase subunit F [bacterium]|nr:V-type ATP synthase subunit F [bacterium]MBR5623577.1 V-type ATP synthase subunit F [bacterium]